MKKSKTLIVKRPSKKSYEERVKEEFGEEYYISDLSISWEQYYENLKKSGILKIGGALSYQFKFSENEDLPMDEEYVIFGFPDIFSAVKTVSLSIYHLAILMADSTLYMCGDNYFGQLGTSKVKFTETPIPILDRIRDVKCGFCNTFMTNYDQDLYFCGLDIKQDLSDVIQIMEMEEAKKLVSDRRIFETDYLASHVQDFYPGVTSVCYLTTDSNLYYLGNLSTLSHQIEPFLISKQVKSASVYNNTLAYINSKNHLYLYGQSPSDNQIFLQPTLISREPMKHVAVGWKFMVAITLRDEKLLSGQNYEVLPKQEPEVSVFNPLRYKKSFSISSIKAGLINYILLTEDNQAYLFGSYYVDSDHFLDSDDRVILPPNSQIKSYETGFYSLAFIYHP